MEIDAFSSRVLPCRMRCTDPIGSTSIGLYFRVSTPSQARRSHGTNVARVAHGSS